MITAGDALASEALDEELVRRLSVRLSRVANENGGRIIDAALIVLADGRARTADEIYREALERHALTAAKKPAYVYTALQQYIERRVSTGRMPLIIQDPDRRFRLNQPADDWPEPTTPLKTRVPIASGAAVVARLRGTGRSDPDAFELAVCDAFAAFGFDATHVGGQGAPDGYVDAPLGPLGYRAMLECKSARGRWVSLPDAAEAARYRERYGGQYATLVGPAFSGDKSLADELQAHRISAWTTDDFETLYAMGSDPLELRTLFEQPGYVADRIATLRWERDHGRAKRVAVVCELLLRTLPGVQRQTLGHPESAPHVDVDAAMLLIDGALVADGAHRPCTRDDVVSAFRQLTHPLDGRAVYVDETETSIVAGFVRSEEGMPACVVVPG